jgi:hypothetical protein
VNAGDPSGRDLTATQCIEDVQACDGSTSPAPGSRSDPDWCDGGTAFGFDPTPNPDCPDPGGAPPPQQPQPNCTIGVDEGGAPINGQDVTLVNASSNQLGLEWGPNWAKLFVQIQANLFGDTNGHDWSASQSAYVTGEYQLTQNGPIMPDGINSPNDGPNPGVVASGQGFLDYLDAPGLTGLPGYYQSYTFTFQSSVYYNAGPPAVRPRCSIIWGFTLTDVNGSWSLVSPW